MVETNSNELNLERKETFIGDQRVAPAFTSGGRHPVGIQAGAASLP